MPVNEPTMQKHRTGKLHVSNSAIGISTETGDDMLAPCEVLGATDLSALTVGPGPTDAGEGGGGWVVVGPGELGTAIASTGPTPFRHQQEWRRASYAR